MASRLPEPIFTPATKAERGAHDENISFDAAKAVIGAELAFKVQTVSLTLYRAAAEYALTRGIIIADTKFEFGTDADGQLRLMDEVLTADSSRFWPADEYEEGKSPPSFDKQFVRDWLEAQHWNKAPPPPDLPAGHRREDGRQVPRGVDAPDRKDARLDSLQSRLREPLRLDPKVAAPTRDIHEQPPSQARRWSASSWAPTPTGTSCSTRATC